MRPRSAAALFAVFVTCAWAGFAHTQTVPPGPPAAPPPDSLDGTWEIVSLIEDGKPVTQEMVKQTLIGNARVAISGQLLTFAKPDGAARTLAFVTDATANPKRVDLAGATHIGGKGIYLRDGDTLLISFPMTDSDARPADFASIPGKNTVAMTLTRVKASPPVRTAPPARDLPPPPPPAAPKATDDDLRAALLGTWGHQTDDIVLKGTLNPDGTFSTVQTFKRGLKKVFNEVERSSGTWHVKDGVVIFTTKSSTERDRIGRVSSYRVTSITSGEVIYIDNESGARRVEWKLR